MMDNELLFGPNLEENHSRYEKYLSGRIRSWIEQSFYAKIDAHAQLDELLDDASFVSQPLGHSSLFADHGVVHARDVARQTLRVLDNANGVLFPERDLPRLEFMKGYGVLLSFVHDIGLCDLSHFGRKMHAYTVAQIVLSPQFDKLLEVIWEENAGNVPRVLTDLTSLDEDPRLVLREMLALAICHSKSAIPVKFLCAPAELRTVMLRCATTDLQDMFRRIKEFPSMYKTLAENEKVPCPLESEGLGAKICAERVEFLRRYYEDFSNDGFLWLINEQPAVRQLVNDVLDTLRALRCADALRQRGTTLKTSGNYEIFVDRKTGNAIFALRQKDRKLLLVDIPDPISAGEANLASCELARDGNLRVSFHRGSFQDAATIHKAVSNLVMVLADIQKDVIESFQRPPPPPGIQKDWEKDSSEMQILLENVGDNPEFAFLVCNQLQQSNPTAHNPVRVVSSLKDVSENKRDLYFQAQDLDWDDTAKRAALDRIAISGHKTSPIDPRAAFHDVKQIKIPAGYMLLEAGVYPGFVYIPLSGMLRVIPLGNYPSFTIQPWMPLGVTAVIRGAFRNATVITEEEVSLLMIPQEIYLKYWHHIYSLNEFIEWMEKARQREKEAPLT